MPSITTEPSCIQFIQVNVNKQNIAQQTALQNALESKVDIVLLQELYCYRNYNTGSFIALNYSAFYTIALQPGNLTSIKERLRVLTYIRKAARIEFSTRYNLCNNPDTQVIEVLNNIEPFYIVNVYNKRRLVEGSTVRQYTAV
jgi:exonuclease III